jgi:hypothetical protein
MDPGVVSTDIVADSTDPPDNPFFMMIMIP